MKEMGNRLFPKILVVEDETIIAEDIRMTLMDYGYEVTGVATSGEEAIQKAAETEPDLIIMDIMLSGDITGIEAADEIYHRSGIPVIYLTAYSDEKTLQNAKFTEPIGYLLKPFEEKELHATIQTVYYRFLQGQDEFE